MSDMATMADNVRTMGANLRAALVSNYAIWGHKSGLRVSRRYLHEIAGHTTEVHGAEVAAEMLYEAADRLVEHKPFTDPEPAPTVIDLVTPADAEPAPPPAEPKMWVRVGRSLINLLQSPFLWGMVVGALLVGGNQ